MTTLARLTALPLPGKLLGTTVMLLSRGVCFAKSKLSSGQHHSMQDQRREPSRTPVMSSALTLPRHTCTPQSCCSNLGASPQLSPKRSPRHPRWQGHLA